MNIPDNMTLKATVEKSGDSGTGKREKRSASLSDRFSWPGRIAILAAIVYSPWVFASVPYGPQFWIVVLLMLALAFWWFETALNKRNSQVFPFISYLVMLGAVIGLIQLMPLPDFLLNLLSGRQSEIYQQYSGIPEAAVSITLDREGTRHQLRLLTMAISGLLLGCRLFRTKRDAIILLSVATTIGIAISIFGIIQRFSGTGQEYWFSEIIVRNTWFGPFVNRNNGAGYLGMCLACSLGLTTIVFQKRSNSDTPKSIFGDGPLFSRFYYQTMHFISKLNALKISLLLANVVLAVGIIATTSRGGVVAMLGAGVGTLLLFGIARQPKNTLTVFLPILCLILVLSAWLGIGEGLVKRFENIDMINTTNTDVRMVHWADTYPAVADMGIFGSGLGSYSGVHRLYRSTDHEIGIFQYAENQFFQALVEAGWPGLIIFLIAWVLALHYAYLLLFKGNSPLSVGVGTCGFFLLFSQALASCFDFGFYIPANLLLLSTLVGFLAYQAQSLAGRLKKGNWLKFTTPNYFVQGVVLVLFAGATLGALELHQLTGIQRQLRSPKMNAIDRLNMPIEETERRINLLKPQLAKTPYTKGLNYLGELYLHRSRLSLFDEIIAAYTREELLALDISDASDEEKIKARMEVIWNLTDVQRIQENAYSLKTYNSLLEARDFLGQKRVQDNFRPALEAFLISRGRSPIQPIAHLRIGEIKGALWALTDNGEGDQDIENALKLTPNNANFRLVAGVHYLQSNKAKEATPHLRRFLELMPKQSTYLFRLLTGGESRTVTPVSEEMIAFEIIPDDPHMLYEYAADFVMSGSEVLPKILEKAERLVEEIGSSRQEFILLSGDINNMQGDIEDATQDYRRALINRPNDPQTRYKMALLLEKQGRIEEASEQADWLDKQIRRKREYNELIERLRNAMKNINR